jgi:hypothetical protein
MHEYKERYYITGVLVSIDQLKLQLLTFCSSLIGGVTTGDFSEIVFSPICAQADAFQGEMHLSNLSNLWTGSCIYLIYCI